MSGWETLRIGWRRSQDRQRLANPINIDFKPIQAQNGDARPEHRSTDAKETALPQPSTYLEDILTSSAIPLLVADRDLKLRFFTPAAAALLKVSTSDFGRLLVPINFSFADDDLLLDAETVMATGMSLSSTVNTDEGACLNRYLLPYRNEKDDVQGIVIHFADISAVKLAESAFETAQAYSNGMIDVVRQSLLILDEALRIVSANPFFYRSFAVKPADAVGEVLTALHDRCLDVQGLRSFLDWIAVGHDVAEDYAIEVELPPHGRRIFLLNARNIPVSIASQQRILLAIDDITHWKNADAVFEAAKTQAKRTRESFSPTAKNNVSH
jgi:two-component system, chemotaxis family, CheB/CheR fusion protein